jgi:hypothetical protein
LDRVPNESDVRRYWKPMPFSGAQIILNFARDAAVDPEASETCGTWTLE